MKFRLFLFVLAICLTNNLSAQSVKSKVFPYSVSKGNVSYSCLMDERQAIDVETSTFGTLGLYKILSSHNFTLSISIVSYAKTVIRWANSIKGDKATGFVYIALTDGTKLSTMGIIKDARLGENKGSDSFGGVLFGIPLNTEELIKVTKKSIKSIEYDGSTLYFDTSCFVSAPTLSAMYETLKNSMQH